MKRKTWKLLSSLTAIIWRLITWWVSTNISVALGKKCLIGFQHSRHIFWKIIKKKMRVKILPSSYWVAQYAVSSKYVLYHFSNSCSINSKITNNNTEIKCATKTKDYFSISWNNHSCIFVITILRNPMFTFIGIFRKWKKVIQYFWNVWWKLVNNQFLGFLEFVPYLYLMSSNWSAMKRIRMLLFCVSPIWWLESTWITNLMTFLRF